MEGKRLTRIVLFLVIAVTVTDRGYGQNDERSQSRFDVLNRVLGGGSSSDRSPPDVGGSLGSREDGDNESVAADSRGLPQGGRIPDYRLAIGDVLEVKVIGEPELDSSVKLDPNGEGAPELLDRIALAGLTLDEAELVIRDAYMVDYLVDPRVSVRVLEYGKSTFAILGEVNTPGYFFFPSNKKMDLLEAVAMAGGYTRLGSPTRIVLKREVDGEEKVLRLNAKAMASGSQEPFILESGDIITVRQSIF